MVFLLSVSVQTPQGCDGEVGHALIFCVVYGWVFFMVWREVEEGVDGWAGRWGFD